MKRKKQFLAILLAASLLTASLGGSVFAEQVEQAPGTTTIEAEEAMMGDAARNEEESGEEGSTVAPEESGEDGSAESMNEDEALSDDGSGSDVSEDPAEETGESAEESAEESGSDETDEAAEDVNAGEAEDESGWEEESSEPGGSGQTDDAGEEASDQLDDGTDVPEDYEAPPAAEEAGTVQEDPVMGAIEGETDLSATTLTEDRVIDGDAYISNGFVDLNGHSLTINGSLVQEAGVLLVNGGSLIVRGDYRLQDRSTDMDPETGDINITYGENSNGVLAMHDEDDYVKVEGDFYHAGDANYNDLNGTRVDETFTAGTFEIGRGFYQIRSNESPVRAAGTHRFLVKGSGEHIVSFANSDNYMAALETDGDAAIDWQGWFNVGKLGSDVTLHAVDEDGIMIRSENGRMDFYGHKLTVDGNVATIIGNLYIGGASLAGGASGSRPDAMGSLTVDGNILQPDGVVVIDGGALTVTGDYRIQDKNDDGTYGTNSNGVLAMHNEDDYVKVEGDFYHAGDVNYNDLNGTRVDETFTAGTFEIGKGFYQIRDNESPVRAAGTHRFLAKGSSGHTVSFANRDNYIATLETEGGASIDWQGWFNVGKLGSDVTLHAVDEDGISIRSENGRMDFYGHKLTVNGNVATIVGKLYIGGASLAGGGGSRPDAMGSLTVEGNLLQPEGAVVIDGGALTVTGDYRIQDKNSDGSYGTNSNGVLAMHNEDDYVKVEGDFYHAGDVNYNDLNGTRVDETFTAGTLEIGKGFYQIRSNESPVRAAGTHRFLAKGSGEHKVSFANRENYIATLETEGEASIDWQGWFNVGKLGSDVTVNAVDKDGIMIRTENGRMDFYGHELTVEGNVQTIVGKLYIGGASLAEGDTGLRPDTMGSLTVDGNILQPEGAVVIDGGALTVTGDYRIQQKNEDGTYGQSNGVLAMHKEEDSVKIGGSFYTAGDANYNDKNSNRVDETLTAGTLEIGGSFFQMVSGETAFKAGGTHKTIMTGTGNKAVQFLNKDCKFHILEIKQDPSKYLFSRVPCWDQLIYKGNEISEDAFNYTAVLDASKDTYTITKWVDDSEEIVLPEKLSGFTIGGIADEVFRNRTNLKSVTLPGSLTTLGNSVFRDCTNLKKVVMPGTVTSMGSEVFRNTAIETAGPSGSGADYEFGWTDKIPDYAFHYIQSLTDVNLPDSLTQIGSYAFNHCDALTTLYIPDGVTTIGAYAFHNCANLTMVAVPDSVESIDNSFQKTDKLVLYVFPGSYAEEYAEEHDIPYEYATNLGHSVQANVKDPDGKIISGGYEVYWYRDDTDELLGSGSKLRNVEEGTQILCRVFLGEELGTVYEWPEDVAYTASDKDGTVEIALTAFGKRAVTGTVKDSDGNPIQGASVQLRQIYNEVFEKTSETESGETGAFSFDADRTRAVLTVSAEGYYDGIYAVSGTSESETAVIAAVLEKLPADKITLPLARMSAAADGEEPVVTVLQNANGLAFSAYNETQDKEVKDLRVQYPYLILPDRRNAEAPAAGDVIRITITDNTGKLADGQVRVTLDEYRCGSASWTLVENGSIRLTGMALSDEEAEKAMVMVFDSTGRIVETGSAEGAYTTGQLPAGAYTVVLMEKTSLLTSVDHLARFDEFGLSEENKDFVKKNVTVEEGVIRVLGEITVPDFDESKLYYTVENNTRVWAGSSRAVTGQYVTMRAMYEIADQYTTSGETVLLDIPAGMTFIEGSLTVNGRPAACTVTENPDGGSSVSVPVNTAKGTLRFYVLPVSAGTKKLHAYLSFTNKNGTESAQEVTQPIGTAVAEVSAAAISVPDETGFRQVTATGRAIAGCQVTVYDNGTAVGTTTSNKNGSWSLEFELVRPMKFSFHEIYAAVKSTEYDVDIETDVAELLYNINFVEVAKVTMINTAHPDDSLKPKEFNTVFDFLHPSSAVPTYNYWPSYPTFTFLVEFTGGDADVLSNVNVVTTDSSGERTYVPCTYDEIGRVWTGTHDYRTFSDVPCKVTVSCDNWSGEDYDDSMEAEDMVDMLANAVNLDQNMSTRLGQTTAGANEVFGDETISFDLTVDGIKIADYKLEMLDFEEFRLEDWAADNYMEFEDENGSISYQTYNLTGDTYTVRTAYPDERLYAKETMKLSPDAIATGTAFGGTDAFLPSRAESAVFRGTAKGVTLDNWIKAYNRLSKAAENWWEIVVYLDALAAFYDVSAELIGQGLDYVSGQKEYDEVYKRLIGDWEGLKKNAKTLKKHLDRMERVVKKKNCKCLSDDYMKKPLEDFKMERGEYIKASLILAGGAYAADGLMARCSGLAKMYASQYGKGANQTQAYRFIRRQALEKSARLLYLYGSPFLSGPQMKKLREQYTAKYVNFADNTWISFVSSINVRKSLDRSFQDLDRRIRVETEKFLQAQCPCGKNCKCDHEEPKEDPEKKKEQEVVPKADPSGFVYEAVPSNRVEGVTATIYQYTYAVDEFGMQDEEKSEILWDAENYDQVNPQTTNLYGTFAWDVPEGSWVVKFTKDGYKDADSYHDTAATSVGENGKNYLPVPPIQTEVNTAMVSKAAPTVSTVSAYPDQVRIDFSQYMQINTVNSSNVTVTIGGKAVKGTITPLNAEDNYEKTAQYASSFAFTPSEEISGTVKVAVKGVKNYNGKSIAKAYSGNHEVVLMPRSLTASGAEEIKHHESGELTVKVLPAEAGGGRTVTITSYSPSIVSAREQTATTDENGVATFVLDGKLLGQGVLSVSLDGTTLTSEVSIDVVREPAQTINLENGAYTVNIAGGPFVYDGKQKTPAATIDGLTEGTDFTVAYSSNTNAGTATVTVTGTGRYTGTLSKDFTIEKAAQNFTVKAGAASINTGKTTKVTASGAKEKPRFTFTSSNTKVATVDTAGTVTGKSAGTVTITVKAAETANYKTASKTVKITVNKVLKKPGNCHFIKWNNSRYTSCRIGWNKTEGADGYETLLSWTDGSHASRTIVKSNVLYRDCTVHPQHVSQMMVRAFYMSGGQRKFGPWSNVEYITPSPTRLTTKNASSGANLKMNISWNIIYGCNGYNVFLTTNPNGTWYWNQSTSIKATATSAVITKHRSSRLKKNTRYYVRIVTRRQRNGVFCTVPMPAANTYIGTFIIK